MTAIIVTMLILAYLLIATGHLTGVNKAAIAMFLGTVGWVVYVCFGEDFVMSQHPADYSEALYHELKQMIEQEGLIDVFYERAFERLIPQGHTFRVVDTTCYFSYELDTPEDFQRAQELMPKELL